MRVTRDKRRDDTRESLTSRARKQDRTEQDELQTLRNQSSSPSLARERARGRAGRRRRNFQMSYSEEHLHDVVKSQLADAIVTSHVRSPVKLAEYMRRELQEFEADYPGTIEAAWRKLHPDPEYVDPGLYVHVDYERSDVEVGRDAIQAFREHMGWQRPAKNDRLEAAYGDVRGFTRPELHLVMPDLEPDDELEEAIERDDNESDPTIGLDLDEPDDDATNDVEEIACPPAEPFDVWNQEPA